MNPQLPQPQPTGQPDVAGVPVPQGQSPAVPMPVPAQTTPVQSADDGDVIELEWIHKTEQVIKQTQSDPYQQARALNALKADYIQKRYNKEVKVVEE